MTHPPSHRVLIVTGGILSSRDPSWTKALSRQISAMRGSGGAWLDLESKLHLAENVIAARSYLRSNRFERAPYADSVRRFFSKPATDVQVENDAIGIPELSEVVLATLLRDNGMPFAVTTYAAMHADRRHRERLLKEATCVFASTTLLRDHRELETMMALLKRPWNRVVAGGALAGILHRDWSGGRGVDLLAVGYAELMMAQICAWIRSNFTELSPPPAGRVDNRGGTPILHSGVPTGTDLDFLTTPDWQLAEDVHERRFTHVNYESVRGCPYRCGFCNYPYLFDDHRFRYRSAGRIAEDWRQFAAAGVQYVTCLDSLFTMPRRRLIALCEQLIADGTRLKWTCYARSDDLADRATCDLLKAAGCHQVQIGFESGSQEQLDRMNKHVRVHDNVLALQNCREAGITTLVSVIVGYPGETRGTVDETFAVLRDAPPDVFYLAPFNVRVPRVPVLDAASRARFGLRTQTSDAAAPYWTHTTMSCTEVVGHVARLHLQLVEHRVALEGALFYDGMLWYDPADRADLLDFQFDAQQHAPIMRRGFGALRRMANRRLRTDAQRTLGPVPHAAMAS